MSQAAQASCLWGLACRVGEPFPLSCASSGTAGNDAAPSAMPSAWSGRSSEAWAGDVVTSSPVAAAWSWGAPRLLSVASGNVSHDPSSGFTGSLLLSGRQLCAFGSCLNMQSSPRVHSPKSHGIHGLSPLLNPFPLPLSLPFRLPGVRSRAGAASSPAGASRWLPRFLFTFPRPASLLTISSSVRARCSKGHGVVRHSSPRLHA